VLWNLPVTDSAESDIVIKALAFRRSTTVYRMLVAKGYFCEFGRRANIGRRSGAYPLSAITQARCLSIAHLMKDTAIIGRNVSGIEKKTLLHFRQSAPSSRKSY
jgi:hypothetical protein